MTDADIKKAIKSIEIHHEHGWWIADMPDIGVATQAKTLPELGVEIERIVVAHFTLHAEIGTDPFRCQRSSTADIIAERFCALVTKALDGWDRAARALADDPHHADEHLIAALRKESRDVR
jgi:hypothetical protein